MNSWTYFIFGIIAYQIAKMVYLIATKELGRRRERLFLRQVKIEFPDADPIRLTSIETSDKAAMEDLQRQLAALHVEDPETDEFEMLPFPKRP
jgi:hypothetical protein